ncbi:cytochrome d ubiquinol oxidase subunit II [Anatilimnocola floriformis]|uniref:cytochrome d ubiquinol oxidase subunit II n=1 Tax=Anatilimnocola floriformis TaxID=2948575 RepID=UPI0020C2E016|nr:cytochrome d ubiquinol oxidase subunit II [Anatilimnocola floriformis]
MISTELLVNISAAAALFGMMAYGMFGGADFGGGVWDLFATGPRKREQRLAIQKAMGPVWEANHVWLIFVVVVLFTCFPRAYSKLAIALFVPFHLALVGIILRGASFVFRSYQAQEPSDAADTSIWGVVFGVASIISPVLLGAAFGVVTEGLIQVKDGQVEAHPAFWLTPYALANGLLALVTCAYLAAVYLTNETQGELREDFRYRAILAGTGTAALAGIVLALAWFEARWFVDRMLSPRALPVVIAGLFCFAASAWAVFTRRYVLSRVFAAGEICMLILGWGLAQHPFLVYPDLTFETTAAPHATLLFLVLSLPVGGLLLVPSLFYLFRVFKS